MTTAAHRHDAVAARCFEAWNADGAEARAKAVADVGTTDGRCTGPLSGAVGHEAVTAAARERFPAFVLRLAGSVDGHHDTARFPWEPVDRVDGSAPVAGSDVIAFDAEDRARAVHGFLDRVPEGA